MKSFLLLLISTVIAVSNIDVVFRTALNGCAPKISLSAMRQANSVSGTYGTVVASLSNSIPRKSDDQQWLDDVILPTAQRYAGLFQFVMAGPEAKLNNESLCGNGVTGLLMFNDSTVPSALSWVDFTGPYYYAVWRNTGVFASQHEFDAIVNTATRIMTLEESLDSILAEENASLTTSAPDPDKPNSGEHLAVSLSIVFAMCAALLL